LNTTSDVTAPSANRQAEQGALTGMFWTGPVRVLLAKASVV
jgi:hypothetical protein